MVNQLFDPSWVALIKLWQHLSCSFGFAGTGTETWNCILLLWVTPLINPLISYVVLRKGYCTFCLEFIGYSNTGVSGNSRSSWSLKRCTGPTCSLARRDMLDFCGPRLRNMTKWIPKVTKPFVTMLIPQQWTWAWKTCEEVGIENVESLWMGEITMERSYKMLTRRQGQHGFLNSRLITGKD